MNSKNIAKTEIRFKNVYPISLGSLSYNVQASDVDYLQVAASFNYLNYDIACKTVLSIPIKANITITTDKNFSNFISQ